MIKGLGEFNGRPLVLLGLSEENVTRLRTAEPTMFDAAPLGIEAHVLITYGSTEQAIVAELRAHGVNGVTEEP